MNPQKNDHSSNVQLPLESTSPCSISRVRYTKIIWTKRFASQALHIELCYLCLKVLENISFLASICRILNEMYPYLNILVKRGQTFFNTSPGV